MAVADIIKSSLSMQDIAERYGFEVDRGNFICCPFHSDKTASLKIYKEVGRGFHCFGCGAGGSVIDFVMLLFKIDFRQAVVRINADFGLGLSDEKPDRRAVDKWKRERSAKEAELQAYRDDFDQKVSEYRRLWYALNHKAPAFPGEAPDPVWLEAKQRIPYLDYWFSENHWR